MFIQKILDFFKPSIQEKSIRIEQDENISMLHPRGTTITLFSYRVPHKSKLTITHFSNYLNLPGHWSHVIWSIRRNGVGVSPYGAILDQTGLSTQPRLINRLIFNGGDELIITATDDNSIAQPPELATGVAIRYEAT